MDSSTTERELLELEKQYWRALKDKDVDGALRLTEFPCIITGARGLGASAKRAFASMVEDPPYTINSVDVDDSAQVRMLTDDVAVLAYKVHEELTVDGEHVALDAADSSTWVRRNGRWLCALHTEAIVGDPFGRDRTPTVRPPASPPERPDPIGRDASAGMSDDERAISELIASRIEENRKLEEVSVRGDWAWSRTRLEVSIALPHATALQRTDYTLTIWHRRADGHWLFARDTDLLASE